MWTCNWLDLQTLGSQPVMLKSLPDHCIHVLYLTQLGKVWATFGNITTDAMIGENRQLDTNEPV